MVDIQHNSFRIFLARQALQLSQIAGAWRAVLPPIEAVARKLIVEKGDPVYQGSRRAREDKYYMIFNVVRAALKGYDRCSGAFKEKIISLFLKEFLSSSHESIRDLFFDTYGIYPPGFATIAPEGTCNLKCKNCYAASISGSMPRLSAQTFSRILDEKYQKWGSWFTVISGGEPFLWRDGDCDLIDMAHIHPEQFFLVYTNGTLLDKERCRRIAKVGNITPAISVEGLKEATEKRRGIGTFDTILTSFENLREAGVPFGISCTLTKENQDVLFNDTVIDYYCDTHGALYVWVFQYMPLGRGIDIQNQISPAARHKLWEREQELARKRRLVIADFWNGGMLSQGCIAGGREDGYLYIDWNGNIYPCAFMPYWKDSIQTLFNSGKTLTDALFSDLFTGVRKWQRRYSFRRHPQERSNELRPCFMRDHHDTACQLIRQTGAKPANDAAAECLNDYEYHKAMVAYGKEIADVMDPIWEREYRVC